MHTARGLDVAGGLGAEDLDAVEFRADLVRHRSFAHAFGQLKLPVIGTVRSRDEGGDADPAPTGRKHLFERLIPVVTAIDIELRHADGFSKVIRHATAAGKEVIASFHDFRGTPSLENLRYQAKAAEKAGATIFKVATFLRTPSDLAQLFLLLDQKDLIPIAAMGMGPLGRASRLSLAAAGSLLNYGWLDCPQVSGQWPALVFRYRLSEALSDS